MPRYSEDFWIRENIRSGKFITNWPKWFIYSRGLDLYSKIKLDYKIDPKTGSITFSFPYSMGYVDFRFRLLDYFSKINKKRYNQILNQQKEENFNKISEEDRGYLFASTKKEVMKRDIEKENNRKEKNIKQLDFQKEILRKYKGTKKHQIETRKIILDLEKNLRDNNSRIKYLNGMLRLTK